MAKNVPGVEQVEHAATRGQAWNASVSVLRTEADRARGLFGFGRRILVPPDEIHVVVGHGRHIYIASNERKVFGQSADRPARYWLNSLTQVIKLKTISFTVPIRGVNDRGVQALDSSKVSFQLWAHAVAKLNPEKAEIAAQRVGLDTTGLVNTITEVGTAELVAACATMDLEEIIANRQKLAEIAFPKVNQILSELGYDLALLTLTRLAGMAYDRLVEQAEARVSKETSIATNLEQVAELQDRQARERNEAEIRATTEKKLASEKREVETAALDQQEALAVRQHEFEVKQVTRAKLAAAASHDTDLAKTEMAQKLGIAEAEKAAQIAKMQTERDAELRALQQKRNAAIKLAETEAEAERLAAEQARQIERAAQKTQAEARRLREEELATAERQKEVAVTEANQLGEALTIEAEAQARALKLRTEAETKADMVRAETEATATEKRAQAAKIRAEATRAETAAPGLAEAEVATAQVEVSQRQVDVTRAEGLAAAEVSRAQAEAEAERMQRLKEVDINAQKQLAALYEKAPVLVELEKMRIEMAHKERLATIQMDAYKQAFEAIAPGVRVNIFGSGGQATQVLTDLLSFSHGLGLAGEEIPALGSFLNRLGSPNGLGGAADLVPQLAEFSPYIRQVIGEVSPRMFTTLKISDLMSRIEPVLAGREDLLSALGNLKQDANFRIVGNLPVTSLLSLLGIELPAVIENDESGVVDGNGKSPKKVVEKPDPES